MAETMVGVDLSPFAPRVATAWASESPGARSKTVAGSLVFADISGFTALSERLAKRGPIGAEELTGILGECFAGLLAVAYAEGGSLIKFGGDALLLLFDGPAHEVRATRAALGMRASIRTVGRLQTSVGTVRLRMSQGVHSGDIDLFRVGDSHDELIICGPVASDVIRMESVADAGEIVVSDATAAALRAAIPDVVGERKGPGTLLRARTLVHIVEGYPAVAPAPEAAARSLPSAVREHLEQGGGEPEHRHVAIAFVHFDGTDAMRRRAGTGAVAEALDELVRVIQTEVDAEDVTFLATDIDKDGGKVILASGTPTAHEDAEGRLLRAVRRIADAHTRLRVRIGVNRGHVFAGTVGPPYRRTYTVMGDAVNLSARLMAKAGPGEIVVHPSVLELSRTAFATTPMEPFLVKGKTAPINAVLLGQPVGTQDIRPRTEAPLIGRDDELAALRAAIAGPGRVCEIVGDTGLGKTRLLREARGLAPDEFPLRIVSCEQYERSTPYFSIGVLLRHALGLPGTATADDVDRAVATVDPASAAFAPLIGDVVGIAMADTAATARLQRHYRRLRTSRLVADLLAKALAGGAALAFDDVQWMDDASSDVVAHMRATIDDRPYSLVVTRRPDERDGDGDGDTSGPVDGATRITLDRLPDEVVRRLVAALTGDEPLLPHKVDALVERCGGNPLFVEELTRVAAIGAAEDLPDTLEAVIGTQIDALAPQNRRHLRYAAVLGESFDPSLFADVVADETVRQAGAIVHRLGGLLVPTPDGRVQFRHRLIRDVAYRTLPFGVRRDLHARAAQVVERLVESDGVDRSEVLSLHCFHAQQFEKCWAYATDAAERAADKYALVEASDLYERALEAARDVAGIDTTVRARAWEALGAILVVLGRTSAAATALEKATRLSESDVPSLVRLYVRRSELAQREGRNIAAMRWVMRAIRTSDGHTDDDTLAERSQALSHAAALRLQLGRLDDAVTLATEAAEIGDSVGAKVSAARACFVIAQAKATRGEYDVAAAHRALELFTELESYENVAVVQIMLGGMAFWEGRWDEALDLYERSRTALEDMGAIAESLINSGNIAEVFADQGRLDEAEAIATSAVETWRSLRHPVGAALAERYVARVELRRGNAAGALERFRGIRDALVALGVTSKLVELDVWIAECLLALGDARAAAGLLDTCLAHELGTGSLEWMSMIRRLRAYAALSDGRIADAWAEADESLAVAQTRGSSFDTALAFELFSILAEHGGRDTIDFEALAQRHELLATLGVISAPAPPIARAV